MGSAEAMDRILWVAAFAQRRVAPPENQSNVLLSINRLINIPA
jgi:hypothetical protein